MLLEFFSHYSEKHSIIQKTLQFHRQQTNQDQLLTDLLIFKEDLNGSFGKPRNMYVVSIYKNKSLPVNCKKSWGSKPIGDWLFLMSIFNTTNGADHTPLISCQKEWQ